MVGIVFLQLADAIRTGKLTRADSFLSIAYNSWPRFAALMESFFCLLGVAYMAICLWGTIPLLRESIERQSYLGNEGVFTIAVWPVKTITVIGLAVCLVQFARLAWQALIRGSTKT